MFVFLLFLLVVLSVVLIALGYAMYRGRARGLAEWTAPGELFTEVQRERYGREQGRFTMLFGVVFFLVPLSIYLVDRFWINPQVLYLWIVVLAVLLVAYGVRIRRVLKDVVR